MNSAFVRISHFNSLDFAPKCHEILFLPEKNNFTQYSSYDDHLREESSERTTRNAEKFHQEISFFSLFHCEIDNSPFAFSPRSEKFWEFSLQGLYIFEDNFADFPKNLFCFFVWVEALRPGQQFFSHVGTEPPLPGYYQYFQNL